MASLSFRLKKGLKIKDKSKPQPIYLRYKNGRSIDYNASIKETVLLDNWDKEKGEVKNRSAIKNRFEINSLINKLKLHFEKFDSYNRANGIKPSEKQVKEHFQQFFTTPLEKPKSNIAKFIKTYVKETETKRRLSKGTIKTYNQTKVVLEEFEKKYYKVDFEIIDLNFYNDFVEYLENRDLTLNSIGKHIKIVKSLMNEALDRELTTNTKFKHKKFKVLREEAFNVYLSEEELKKIEEVDLNLFPEHKKARDLFLVGAYTGLRISDFNNLSSKNITTVLGNKLLKVKTQKTKEEVAIPLHPIVKDVFEKNNGEPPQKIPEQRLNKLIKDVCEWAGIDETITLYKTKGGKKVSITIQKFELVKSHTARRSFCTNAYLSGMSPLDIMSISGHRTEKAFLTYIKATPERKALKLQNSKFFNPNLKVAS